MVWIYICVCVSIIRGVGRAGELDGHTCYNIYLC